MKEIFKDVPGYEGRYRISNFGNVQSMNYQNTGKHKLLTPIKHHSGYLCVHLGESKIKRVHTLVANAFIPNPDQKPCVNHIDGNKQNNRISNLEWATHKENMEHAIKTGLRNPHKNNKPRGNENPTRKPILQFTLDGKFVKRWECISEAARNIGCNPSQINNVAAGRGKSCHGFLWRHPCD